ncbi:MAG: hypothetical protein ACKV0T_17195 [Planctomycetales bacterium]
MPELDTGNTVKFAELLESGLMHEVEYHRFLWAADRGKLRLDSCWMTSWGAQPNDDPFSSVRFVYWHDGQTWHVYSDPASQGIIGESPNIHEDSKPKQVPHSAVALGYGIPVEMGLSSLPLLSASVSQGFVTWGELLSLLDPASARDFDLTWRDADGPRPGLEVFSLHQIKGRPAVRLRIDFHPEFLSAPRVVEVALSNSLIPEGESPQYLGANLLEWRQPVRIDSVILFQECLNSQLRTMPDFSQFDPQTVAEAEAAPLIVLEDLCVHYHVSQIRLERTIDDKELAIVARPGTHVVDTQRDEHYFVGWMGGEVGRAPVHPTVDPAVNPRMRRWAPLAIIAVTLVPLLLLTRFLRGRSRPE